MSRVAGSLKTKVRPLFRFRCLSLLTAILLAGSFLLYSKENFNIFINKSHLLELDDKADPIFEKWFTIDTDGCTIPYLDPLDDSVKKFIAQPLKVPRCPDANHALLGSNENKIWIKSNNFQYYRINTTDKLSCCYRSFFRPTSVNDIESTKIDHRSKYSYCIRFNDEIEVKNEFVRVTCSVEKNIIYDQYFVFAPLKKFAKRDQIFKEISENKTAYNILILGIDSVSRLNFHRTMPNTANYLAEKDAVEFIGYNKVGDNTFPNLIPMLMGLKVTELKKTCYPYESATFDNCPFLWQWFKEAGYYTALVEDAPNLGTFNYARTGFGVTPTDYYLHTFMREAVLNVGAIKDFNAFLCMKDKYLYKVLLDYIEDLTSSLSKKKLFGFFWEISMTHDYLNYPMQMDDDYVNLLRKLENSGYLSKTILLLVSDHGMRWGLIRKTKQGRLEERLPFLYILTPKSFRDNYNTAYNNLKHNSKRLTTPFDVYATLSDLLDLKNVENNILLERSHKSYWRERSVSLFLPVPNNRTCEIANIEDHWCTCHKETALSKDNPQAFEAAKTLVSLINGMLKHYPQCAKLAISHMVDVTEIESGKPDANEVTWIEFMIVVKTTPGDAIFEATLRQDSFDQRWKILGTPSRLNLYGDQSRCVDNSQIKLFCYCISSN